MVRVCVEDQRLAAQLSEHRRPQASAAALATLVRVGVGDDPPLLGAVPAGAHFGLLILHGLVARRLSFGRVAATELLGPGDLISSSVDRTTAPPEEISWEVLVPLRLAELDHEFAARIALWPEIASALLARAGERTDFQLLLSAIRQTKRVEDRVLLVLWHLAERWGDVGVDARVLRLPGLTGQTIAHLVGARRQSVSTAFGRLADRGAVERRPDGSLRLPGPPPELWPMADGALDGMHQARRRADDPHPGASRG